MGLIGLIRSISPILRVIMGLGMMFILPWLWMLIFGLLLISQMTPSYGFGYSNPPRSGGFLYDLDDNRLWRSCDTLYCRHSYDYLWFNGLVESKTG